jgi:hypothetical protein
MSDKSGQDQKDYSCIDKLISRIERSLTEKDFLHKFIKRPKTLISALEQLNEMVEIDNMKQTLVEWIYVLLLDEFQNSKYPTKNNRVLHFCNYGEPGTGKTYASKIVAKIFYALGFSYPTLGRDVFNTKNESPLQTSTKLAVSELKQQASIAGINLSKLKEFHPKKRLIKSPSFKSITGKSEAEETSWRELENSLRNTNLILERLSVELGIESKSYSDSKSSLDNLRKSSLEESPPKTRSISGDYKSSNLVESLKMQSDIKVRNVSESSDIDDDPNIDESVYCVVCGRNELVARFMGQTSGLAYDFLMANRGKTIIIEEAYSLCTGDKDLYGIEALVEINRFMDERPNEIIIGFNGYEKLLLETIFRVQPGLKSRIEQFFDMSGYTPEGLTKILHKQAYTQGLLIDEKVGVVSYFRDNMKYFTSYGRDTLKLAKIIRRTCAYALIEDSLDYDSEFVLGQKIFDLATQKYISSFFDKQSLVKA